MPILSRWFLRAALLYLVAALALTLGRAWPGFAVSARAAVLAPVGVHLLMVGWVTQMIFGVAWWMFPRPNRQRDAGAAGTPAAGWVAFASLNAGLLLRAVAEPSVALGATGLWRTALTASAALQLAGVLLVVALLWPRLEEKQ